MRPELDRTIVLSRLLFFWRREVYPKLKTDGSMPRRLRLERLRCCPSVFDRSACDRVDAGLGGFLVHDDSKVSITALRAERTCSFPYTTKPGGTGIGLVLSRQIAEAHDGTLTLENRGDRAASRDCDFHCVP